MLALYILLHSRHLKFTYKKKCIHTLWVVNGRNPISERSNLNPDIVHIIVKSITNQKRYLRTRWLSCTFLVRRQAVWLPSKLFPNKMQSAGAVFAGVAANFLAVPIDAVFHSTGIFPPMGESMSDKLFGLAFSYRFLLAVLGGYATAKVAPSEPMKHALVLGGVGVVLSSAGAMAMWDFGPNWYPLSLIAISLPCSWAGARLYTKPKEA
jgi:hypothetical protein